MPSSPPDFHKIDPFLSLSPPPISTPSGDYSIPFNLQIKNNHSEKISQLSTLAKEILENPMLQIMLTERIYSLMKEDLTYYREKSTSYGGRI